MKRKSGFTLVEILIVVAIIGLLASIILVGIGGFRARGRDSRRIADLRETQNGLELYFTKNGYYPDTDTWSGLTNLLVGPTAGLGVNAIPDDPTSNWHYGYCRASTNQYVISAYLEDNSNPALSQYPAGSTFPCQPILSGTPSNPDCSRVGAITNKYCLTF